MQHRRPVNLHTLFLLWINGSVCDPKKESKIWVAKSMVQKTGSLLFKKKRGSLVFSPFFWLDNLILCPWNCYIYLELNVFWRKHGGCIYGLSLWPWNVYNILFCNKNYFWFFRLVFLARSMNTPTNTLSQTFKFTLPRNELLCQLFGGHR